MENLENKYNEVDMLRKDYEVLQGNLGRTLSEFSEKKH